MWRRTYLVAGGSLAATLTGGAEAIDQHVVRETSRVREDANAVNVRITETNAPVKGGSLLEVTVEVENTGTTEVRPEITGFFDGEQRTAVKATIKPGRTRTLDYISYRTYPVKQDDDVSIRFEAGGDTAERTVSVLAIEELDPSQTFPNGRITVQPGTSVHFEVESDVLEGSGGETHWFVDGTSVGLSMGPWYSAYYLHRGADYWRTTFDSAGTHEVAAAVRNDEEIYRTTWTVDVTDGGVGAPQIVGQHPTDESLRVNPDQPTELELQVTHSGGTLDRVVWWLGHADIVLAESQVNGAEDTATLEFDGACYGCPIITWVIDEHGTITSKTAWVADEVVERKGELAVTNIETNDPVDTGAVLEVTAELENPSETTVTQDVDLIVGHDPKQVDSQSVTVDGGTTKTVELTFTTATVRRTQTFPARVKTGNRSDEVMVTVIGTDDIGLDVAITKTNSPVKTGEFLTVTAELENTHNSSITQEAQLVVGHDPDVVDTMAVTLDPGESKTITMGYKTATVRNDQEFPVRVQTEGAADEELVFVYVDKPPLLVTSIETNDPVATGDVLEVTAKLENIGESAVTQDIDLIVGHDPQHVDSQSVTVAGGETTTTQLEFETATVRQTQVFPVRVESNDDAAKRNVEVVGTDDLTVNVTITETNDPVDAGDVLEVTAEIENTSAVGVTQEFEFVVGHDPTVVDSASVTIARGNTKTITMSFETALVKNDQSFPVRVKSALGSDTQTVLVHGTSNPATSDLTVSALETNGPVRAGETLEVTATIDNTGAGTASQTVALDVGGSQGVDTKAIELKGGAQTVVTLTYSTTTGNIGERTVTVRTNGDTRSTTVSVTEPAPKEESANGSESEQSTSEPESASGSKPKSEPERNTSEESGNTTSERTPDLQY